MLNHHLVDLEAPVLFLRYFDTIIFSGTEDAYIFSLSPRTVVDESYIDLGSSPEIRNSHSSIVDLPVRGLSY